MKQKSFTQSMSWLHTWCGLLLGWVLFAIFLTGTLAVFDRELNWWMQPELKRSALDQAGAATTAQQWLEKHHPQEQNWNIGLPTERSPVLSVSVGEQRRGERTYLDPDSGEALVFDGVSGKLVQAPPPSRASQLTQRVMAGLHFAQFGSYPMRWLYFICGLVSCAMIATGLVLYTVKQRKQAKSSRRFLHIVERINVATVSGLSLACITMLWGNRLLPEALVGRSGWEVRVFFTVWLASLAHAALRPVMRAWREQLAATALLCIGLPLLDLATGLSSDGIRLGVDVTVLALGLLLAWAMRKIPETAAAPARKSPRLMEAAT